MVAIIRRVARDGFGRTGQSSKKHGEQFNTTNICSSLPTHPTHMSVVRNKLLDCVRWVYKTCTEAKRAANTASLTSTDSIQGMTL